MTKDLLHAARNLSQEQYLRACQRSVEAGYLLRTLTLMKNAPACVSELDSGFYGQVILYALRYDETHRSSLAYDLARSSAPEQIRRADPHLLHLAISRGDGQLTGELLDKGIDVAAEPAMLIYAAAQKKDVYLAHRLMEAGADVNGQNHAALYACLKANDPATGMFLMRCGADFAAFSGAVMENGGRKLDEREISCFHAMKSYWETRFQSQEQEDWQMDEDPFGLEQGDDD